MQLDFTSRRWTGEDDAIVPEGGAWGINDMCVPHPSSDGIQPLRFAYSPISVQEYFEGDVKITVHPEDWWGKLLPGGGTVPGVYQRYVGAGDSVILKIGK